MLQALGLYNTYWALIILYTAFRIPFTTFLIRAYMLDLPRDLDEAARSTAQAEGQIFWRIILPALPADHRLLRHPACPVRLERVPVRHGLHERPGVQTLPVGLTSIMAKHGTNYAVVFAGDDDLGLPIVIVFFAAQRYFIRGLSEGIGK